MKKLLIAIVLLVVLYVSARPYVAVSLDEWGFAVRTRTSVSQKFSPDPLFAIR